MRRTCGTFASRYSHDPPSGATVAIFGLPSKVHHPATEPSIVLIDASLYSDISSRPETVNANLIT